MSLVLNSVATSCGISGYQYTLLKKKGKKKALCVQIHGGFAEMLNMFIVRFQEKETWFVEFSQLIGPKNFSFSIFFLKKIFQNFFVISCQTYFGEVAPDPNIPSDSAGGEPEDCEDRLGPAWRPCGSPGAHGGHALGFSYTDRGVFSLDA